MTSKCKKSRLAGELGLFMRQYARKAQASSDPNDRRYDRKLEKKMKRLSPVESFSALQSRPHPREEHRPSEFHHKLRQ